MGIENPTPTYIDDLDVTLPAATDPLSQADDHIRIIKAVLKQTFPNITGAVTKTQAQLNSTSAATLSTARSIGLGGDVSGSANFDGSANITITATVADDSHNHVTGNIDGLDTALAGKLGTSDTAANSHKVDGKSISVVTSMPSSPDNNTIYFVT